MDLSFGVSLKDAYYKFFCLNKKSKYIKRK